LAWDAAAHRLYVTNEDGSVSVVDTDLLAVERTIALGFIPFGIALDNVSGEVYLASFTQVKRIEKGGVEASTFASVSGTFAALAVDSDHQRVYVAANTNSGNAVVSALDERTAQASEIASIPGTARAIAVDGNSIYVVLGSDTSSGTLAIVDATAHVLVGTVPVGANASSIAIDSAMQRAYVTGHADDTVYVVDTAASKVADVLRVGLRPMGIAVDASSRKVYVSADALNSGTVGALFIIDEATDTVSTTSLSGFEPGGAQGVAIDSATHVVYLANTGDYDEVAHISTGDSVLALAGAR
jgi:YVTN family beta-propeller protein